MLAALALVLAGPAAAAEKCVAPPGTAAIEQYCETVPSASGDQPGSGAAADSAQGQGGAPVTDATADRIAASVGDEAAQSITGVAPGRGGDGPSKSAKPRAPAKNRAPADAEANPLGAVASAASTGAEVGGPLVYSLLALTLLLVAVGWTRFRRTGN